MKFLVASAVALALLALALPAQAQAPNPRGLDLASGSAGTVPFAGSGKFPFTLSVGCADVLQASATGMGSAAVSIGPTNAPLWLNATPVQVEVAATGCDPQTGRANVTGELPFAVSATAPGVAAQTVNLQATLGEAVSNEASATYTVEYNSVFSLTPSVQFPLTVTNKTTTFTVLGIQASNAPSMLMVEDFKVDGGALISGIGAVQYENQAGIPETRTYTVTFTAPSKDWEKATATLTYYGHYNFDGNGGDPVGRQTVTWEFVNGGVKPDGDAGGDSKKSPAPVGAFMALGLLAFAAIRRRKA